VHKNSQYVTRCECHQWIPTPINREIERQISTAILARNHRAFPKGAPNVIFLPAAPKPRRGNPVQFTAGAVALVAHPNLAERPRAYSPLAGIHVDELNCHRPFERDNRCPFPHEISPANQLGFFFEWLNVSAGAPATAGPVSFFANQMKQMIAASILQI
jgi:hypothetical protein